MTKASLKKDLKFLAQQGALDAQGLDDHLDFCIDLGLRDFWNAHPWSWRTRPYELSISSEAEDYEMPSDFGGVRSVRQKSSSRGGSIAFYSKESFDQEFPYPTSYTSGFPIVCTAWKDQTKKKWYMKFIRVPEVGYTVYVDMYVNAGTVETVAEGYESGLMASIEKYLYKLGSAERAQAQTYYDAEIRRLSKTDGAFKGDLTKILQPVNVTEHGEGPFWWFSGRS